MKIAPLAECPGIGEWDHFNPGQTLQKRMVAKREEMNIDRAPATFVGLDGNGGAIGTAAFIFDDLKVDPRSMQRLA